MSDRTADDEQVMNLVATALKLDLREREPFLRSACLGNHELYREVAEVLDWEERMGGFLRRPMTCSTDPDQIFAPGDVVAERFEIIRKLGEGGMGVVYEAFDRKRGQRIAVKAAKPGFNGMLSPELEGALKVRHANVCLVNEIHSAASIDGETDFLTMELLEGETLSALLARKGKLTFEVAEDIARQLCAGLRAAHRSGVIHRDLKAANVILCRDGSTGMRAVITDFGLCGEAAQNGFFGTQRYMAPELLLGKKASTATDIYALGVILYEMIAGLDQEPDSSDNAARCQKHASRGYQRLVSDFLNINPAKRCLAFDRAEARLREHGLSRRSWLGVAAGGLLTVCGGEWMEREHIENWLRPLPRKRFVALVARPQSANAQIVPVLNESLDAIENELARSEANDRDLFVILSRERPEKTGERQWLAKLGDSLGVNLALEVSADSRNNGFELGLSVVDIQTGAVLRERRIFCPQADAQTLPAKAVAAATDLLNVNWDTRRAGDLRPATNSFAALEAFQSAEDQRRKPNNDGLRAAIEGYKKAIEADSGYSIAYAKLAMAYLQLNFLEPDPGTLELARANAAKAIELDPKSADGHLAYAMVFSAKGDFDSAESEIRSAFRLDPTNPKILPWHALIYRRFHRWKEAEQAYFQLQKQRPNYWVAYNELGALLTNLGRYPEAVDAFRVAAAAAPGSALAFSNLGALYFKLGNLSEAEQNYRRSLAIKPNGFAYSDLSETLRVRGKLTSALDAAREAVRVAPADDTNWLGLGDCYEAMNGYDREAREAYRRAASEAEHLIEEDPKDVSARIRLALYRLKIGTAKDVLSFLKKSEQDGETDVDTDLIKGRALELAGKREDALEVIASCLRRGPVAFQIESVKDFRDLTRDARYIRMAKVAR